MVTIKSFDGGEFDVYMAMPTGGYGPGIVVLQEIFGVNEFLRGIASTLDSQKVFETLLEKFSDLMKAGRSSLMIFDPESTLQVQPEPRLDDSRGPVCVGQERQPQPRPEVHDERGETDDDDQIGGGSAHRGGGRCSRKGSDS